jgi:hypothetical protein
MAPVLILAMGESGPPGGSIMMRCPFFEEVLVAFCRAYPVKKMVPSDRLQADCKCTCEGFEDCPLFREVMARVEGTKEHHETAEP